MKKELYTVDSVSDGVLVLEGYESGSILEVKNEELSKGICEGDVVNVKRDKDGIISNIVKKRFLTAQRKAKNRKRIDSLFDD